jgi:trehalose 6-phosphate phosphatase
LFSGPLDVIGDVHGEFEALTALLGHLGYAADGGHPDGRRPVFVGDDLTDEHGFELVNLRGGLSILVGPRAPSVARYALHDVAAVRRWLGVPGEGAA